LLLTIESLFVTIFFLALRSGDWHGQSGQVADARQAIWDNDAVIRLGQKKKGSRLKEASVELLALSGQWPCLTWIKVWKCGSA